MIIYLCSSNTGKIRELSLAARKTDFQVESLPGIQNIAPPEETGSTFEANATLKALFYSQFTEELVLADDSGLEVDALFGAPGIFSARYAGPDASDEENNALLLRELANQAERTARFVCVVAAARKGKPVISARGEVQGEILHSPRGQNGFGYDPLFFYPPLNRSFAELSADEKLGVSHRGQAMRTLLGLLR